MFDNMRNAAQQGFTTLIFGAIIVVFALNFGPGSVAQCGKGTDPVAAKVNGRIISDAEFTKEYSQRFQEMSQYRQGYTVEMAKAEGLKGQVLDAMIGRELLAQESERRGLLVAPQELKESIRKIPGFQTDGKFDKAKYKQYTRYAYITEANFELDFTRLLGAQKMRQSLEDLVTVSPVEVKADFERQNTRADVEFVKFDPAFFKKDFKAVEADEKKLITDDHKALEDYYNQHAQRYNEPRRVRARHILVKVGESAAETDVKKARAKIDGAKARVDKGEDFAVVAKEVSEDSSAAMGGDLGLQGPGVWVKPFEDEANRLKAGEVGNVIRTRFGFHVIKVDEIKDAQKRELKDVEAEIAKIVIEERGLKALASAAAERAQAALKEGKALEAQFPPPAEGAKADPLAPKVEVTGWFNKGSKYVPRLGVAGDVVAAVFAVTKPGPLTKVYEVNNRFFVVNVREREQPDMTKFDEEKEVIEERLKQQARAAVVNDFIKEQREASGNGIWRNPTVVSYDARPAQSSAPIDDY